MQHFYRIVVIAICGVVLSDFHFPLQSLKMCSTHRMRNALQRKIKPGLCSVADPENFGGGDNKNFKHKTSKIRMSSPKLRLIFRPKSEIQTFFPPKIVIRHCLCWSLNRKRKSVLFKQESRPGYCLTNVQNRPRIELPTSGSGASIVYR